MTEALLLALVRAYPHPRALARNSRDPALFDNLHRLEAAGMVRRDTGQFRLTRCGEKELAMAVALARLLARTQPAWR